MLNSLICFSITDEEGEEVVQHFAPWVRRQSDLITLSNPFGLVPESHAEVEEEELEDAVHGGCAVLGQPRFPSYSSGLNRISDSNANSKVEKLIIRIQGAHEQHQLTPHNAFRSAPSFRQTFPPPDTHRQTSNSDPDVSRVQSPKRHKEDLMPSYLLADYERDDLCKSSLDGLRLAVSIHLTTSKAIAEICKEIKRTLDDRAPSLVYRHSNNSFVLQYCGVQIEVEVRPVSICTNGVWLRRLDGDCYQYKKLCYELLSCLQL